MVRERERECCKRERECYKIYVDVVVNPLKILYGIKSVI